METSQEVSRGRSSQMIRAVTERRRTHTKGEGLNVKMFQMRSWSVRKEQPAIDETEQ
jgi:hypothetical protein